MMKVARHLLLWVIWSDGIACFDVGHVALLLALLVGHLVITTSWPANLRRAITFYKEQMTMYGVFDEDSTSVIIIDVVWLSVRSNVVVTAVCL